MTKLPPRTRDLVLALEANQIRPTVLPNSLLQEEAEVLAYLRETSKNDKRTYVVNAVSVKGGTLYLARVNPMPYLTGATSSWALLANFNWGRFISKFDQTYLLKLVTPAIADILIYRITVKPQK